jgi:hypothetical protein
VGEVSGHVARSLKTNIGVYQWLVEDKVHGVRKASLRKSSDPIHFNASG